jgi:hypothetical protein
MKDVLIGRGVIDKDGKKTEKTAKKKAKKESVDVRAAVIEGFKRACWGDRYDELNRYEKELASKGHGKTPIAGVTRAGVAHRQHRKGASDDAGVEANRERLRRKLGKTRPGDMPATPPHLQTNSTTLDKFADVIRERCWKGYKPVKGKKPYSKGSCTKIGEAYKLSPEQVEQMKANQRKHDAARKKLGLGAYKGSGAKGATSLAQEARGRKRKPAPPGVVQQNANRDIEKTGRTPAPGSRR